MAIHGGASEIEAGFPWPDLLIPSSFPHEVSRVEVIETPISWIVLTGAWTYKLKKAVMLEYFDASTLTRRRWLCEEELRLNRRLAAEIYVSVVPIIRRAGKVSVEGTGEIVDYAVRMRQFDGSQELDRLLDEGSVAGNELRDLGARLACFHCGAPVAPSDAAYPHTRNLREAVLGNWRTLLVHLDVEWLFPEFGHLIDWTHDTLQRSRTLLEERERLGCIRECHGDLHARNIVRWGGHLIPFDCLEFDPKLRWIDVMNDVAFLIMDLKSRGRSDLVAQFLSAYLDVTGDYRGVELLPFYCVYRALIRAMVDCMSAESDPARRAQYRQRLGMRIKAAAEIAQCESPLLVLMHGVSGSGKSWLAERLSPRLGAICIRSDVERRRAGNGLPAPAPVGGAPTGVNEGIYSPSNRRRVYARLRESAVSCLRSGMSVIVDAAFLSKDDRASFLEAARLTGARPLIVACEANREVLVERILSRRTAGNDPSEAGVDVLDAQVAAVDPLGPEEHAESLSINTSDPRAVEKLFASIDMPAAGMARGHCPPNTRLHRD